MAETLPSYYFSLFFKKYSKFPDKKIKLSSSSLHMKNTKRLWFNVRVIHLRTNIQYLPNSFRLTTNDATFTRKNKYRIEYRSTNKSVQILANSRFVSQSENNLKTSRQNINQDRNRRNALATNTFISSNQFDNHFKLLKPR